MNPDRNSARELRGIRLQPVVIGVLGLTALALVVHAYLWREAAVVASTHSGPEMLMPPFESHTSPSQIRTMLEEARYAFVDSQHDPDLRLIKVSGDAKCGDRHGSLLLSFYGDRLMCSTFTSQSWVECLEQLGRSDLAHQQPGATLRPAARIKTSPNVLFRALRQPDGSVELNWCDLRLQAEVQRDFYVED